MTDEEKAKLQAKRQELTWFCCCCLSADEGQGYCLNCGAGNSTQHVPRWFVEGVREQASWVGKRYYAIDEDYETHWELRHLRSLQTTFPGRTVRDIGDPDDPNADQPLTKMVDQAMGNRRTISTFVKPEPGESDEAILKRTAQQLPWNPGAWMQEIPPRTRSRGPLPVEGPFAKGQRFYLKRDVDEGGVSGTGIVADGMLFESGKCVLCWRTAVTSIGVYDSIEDVDRIHGHGGKTRVVLERPPLMNEGVKTST